MKDICLALGDMVIRVRSIYDYMEVYCKDYVIKDCSDIDFVVEVSQEDIDYERIKSESEDIKEGREIRHFSDEYLETLAVYRKIAERMIDYNIILFHGSVIAVDGVGYLFTAKSGTGKSPHARLWREHFGTRAVMVNDDKPLIKIDEDGVRVFGTPWDGKHRLSTNIVVPLKAICILHQSEKNHINRVGYEESYPLMLQQTHRPGNPSKLAKMLTLQDQLIKQIPIYSLGCNMEPEAVLVAYEGMQGGEVV